MSKKRKKGHSNHDLYRQEKWGSFGNYALYERKRKSFGNHALYERGIEDSFNKDALCVREKGRKQQACAAEKMQFETSIPEIPTVVHRACQETHVLNAPNYRSRDLGVVAT